MRSRTFEINNQRGELLRGDVYHPDLAGRAPVVVVCHGFKGFKNWGFFPHLGASLAGAGFLGVVFNFSGSGVGADGENFTELDRFAADTISQQVADLGCVLDALGSGAIALQNADLARIGVVGHSRGAATALIRAREDARLGAAVTWAALSQLLRYSERELAIWKERGFMEFLNTRTQQVMRINYSYVADVVANRERFDLVRAVRQRRVALRMLHGEEDLSVRVQEGRELNDAAAGGPPVELVVIPKTGHTFGAIHPWQGTTPGLEAAIEATISWFRTHLTAPVEQAVRRGGGA